MVRTALSSGEISRETMVWRRSAVAARMITGSMEGLRLRAMRAASEQFDFEAVRRPTGSHRGR
jgi:hypothetical protein